MTIAAHPIEPINDSTELTLSYLESGVLKTYASGYSRNEARKILGIKQKQYKIIIHDLTFKYQAVDMFHTLNLALTHTHINRYDLVKDEVKKLALAYSVKVYRYFENSQIDRHNPKKIHNYLSAFLIDVKKEFINNIAFHQELILSPEELNYCILKLKSSRSLNSAQRNQALSTLNCIEVGLTQKLEANNFFNAIRRVFELDLGDPTLFSSDYSAFEREAIRSTKNKFFSINRIEKYSDKEKQLFIYYDLIHFYNKLEDKLLFETQLSTI